jgi:hypothetical protein
VHIGHHRHAARVMFERGVVQPLTAGRHSHLPFSPHAFVKLLQGSRQRRH